MFVASGTGPLVPYRYNSTTYVGLVDILEGRKGFISVPTLLDLQQELQLQGFANWFASLDLLPFQGLRLQLCTSEQGQMAQPDILRGSGCSRPSCVSCLSQASAWASSSGTHPQLTTLHLTWSGALARYQVQEPFCPNFQARSKAHCSVAIDTVNDRLGPLTHQALHAVLALLSRQL